MEFTIRKARGKDIPKIIDLATDLIISSIPPQRDVSVDVVQAYRRADLKGLYQMINSSSFGIYVAESREGEFMGHVVSMTGYVESSTGETQGYIFDLSVVEKYQRLGIGNKLMEAAEKFCRESGMKYVCLNVTTANVKAVNFYLKTGYEEERKRMIKVISTPAHKHENVVQSAVKNAAQDAINEAAKGSAINS